MVALANNTFWYVGSVQYAAIAAWISNHTYAAGVLLTNAANSPTAGNERVYVSIVGGTSTNGTQPTLTATKGAKTVDNGVTWQEVTGQPGVNGDLTNCPVWGATLTTTLGQIIYDSVSLALQIVTTAGTTKSGAQPTFSATAGTTTSDNTTTWTSLGLASNFAAWGAPFSRLRNAFTSTWGAAGDTFYVASNHAATEAAAVTYTFPGTSSNPNKIICASTSAAPPTATAKTATESTTGASTIAFGAGFAYIYGPIFQAGNSSNTASIFTNNDIGGNNAIYLDNCGLTLNNTSASSVIQLGPHSTTAPASYGELRSCDFVFGATGQRITPCGSLNKIIGGTVAATGTVPTSAFRLQSSNAAGMGDHYIRDLDCTAITGTLFDTAGGPNSSGISVTAMNVVVGTGCTLTTSLFSGPGSGVMRCHIVDSTGTNYRYFYRHYLGTIQSETSIVRTGGASDGATPISWNMASNSNVALHQPFEAEQIAQWSTFTSGTHTATIYLTTNTTLDNSKFWVEVECLGSSTTPKGSFTTSQVALLVSPTTLTTDSSTWGGSAQTNKYSVTVSYVPRQAGPVKIRCFLGVNATVYIDPLAVLA